MKKDANKSEFVFWLALVVCLALALGAILLGFYFFRAYAFYKTHKSYYVGNSFIQEDPVIGFVQRPSIKMFHTVDPKFSVYTDTIGARVGKPNMVGPAKTDMLTIGCSVAWGHGVENEKTFSSMLQNKSGMKVVNLGLASYGTTASLLIFKKNIALRPRWVVYGFIEDHLNRNLNPRAPCLSPIPRPVACVTFDSKQNPWINPPNKISYEYFQYFNEILLDHSFGWRDVLWAVRRDFIRLCGKFGPRKLYKPTREQKFAAMSFLLTSMLKETRTIGANLVVVYVPNPGDIQPAPPELIRALSAAGTDILYVDLFESFQKYAKEHGKEALQAGPDPHPGEIAHRLIAEAVWEAIKKKSRENCFLKPPAKPSRDKVATCPCKANLAFSVK